MDALTSRCSRCDRDTMMKNKGQKLMQTNKILNYTPAILSPIVDMRPSGDSPPSGIGGEGPPIPSMADLMAVIQGSKAEVVHKIDVVAIEVNLLNADLRKVTEGLVQTEKNMKTLQQEVGVLPSTVLDMQKLPACLETGVSIYEREDTENELERDCAASPRDPPL
ncbi:hypothetical protein NDU88_008782 [Pleurodeles waltl]|uniref:Uncharacterized protein n=1 Tax=Pleurodeles waltl TaxID=8319 RepID=A0AAV7RU42_PLEWA|nr:hypothetical protein NDU88_008782 [Pleurodeles waltl]